MSGTFRLGSRRSTHALTAFPNRSWASVLRRANTAPRIRAGGRGWTWAILSTFAVLGLVTSTVSLAAVTPVLLPVSGGAQGVCNYPIVCWPRGYSPASVPAIHPGPSLALVNTNTIVACSAVSTCNSPGIAVVAYSSIYVFLSAKTNAQPTAVNDNGGHTYTLDRTIAQSTTVEESVYHTDNVSAAASISVTINFAASQTYTIGVIDIKNVATKSLDAVGVGSTSSGSGTASNSVTATVGNDLIFLGVSLNAANTITQSGADLVVQQVTAGASKGGQLDQQSPSGGPVTLSATFTSTAWAAIAVAVKQAVVPAAPTGLAVGTVTTTTVPLTWSNPVGPNLNTTVFQAAYASGSCGGYSVAYSAGSVHAYTVTGLTPRNVYCFRVADWNSTGQGANSVAVTAIQTANVPRSATGVTVSPVSQSTTSLEVTWTDPISNTGLLNYTIYQTTTVACAGAPTTTSLGVGPQLFFANGLTAGTTYYYTVQEWNVTGGSSQSSCASGTTNQVDAPPIGLGSAGTNLTNLTLVWSNPSGQTVLNNTIYQGSGCGVFPIAYSTGGAASRFVVTGLSPNTLYCFEVVAWTDGGYSIASNTIVITTKAVKPVAPTGLGTTGRTTTTISLSWTNPSITGGSLVNDSVRVGTVCGTWTSQLSTVAAAQSYTVTGLTASTSYCFAVSAWSQGGESPLSTTITVVTKDAAPAAPTNLHFVTSSRTTITFAWTNPAGALVNDTAFYRTGGSCANPVTGVSMGVASNYTLSGLTASTNYAIEVAAWTNGGMSAVSSCLATGTQGVNPPSPVNTRVLQTGSTWLWITWDNPNSYTIFNNTVYWKLGSSCGAPWGATISTGGIVSSYNITGLSPSTTYCIQVTAWDGESAPSNALVAKTLSGPEGGGALVVGAPIVLLTLAGALVAVVAIAGVVYARKKRK